MRLMLGKDNEPELLVFTTKEHSPGLGHFDFTVINGAWDGTFNHGKITIYHPYEPFSTLDKMEILSDNQERLAGRVYEYQHVFDNWDNPDYVVPEHLRPRPVSEVFPDLDDDIPF